MTQLSNHVRIRHIGGKNPAESEVLAVRSWPLQLVVDMSESIRVQLRGIGVTCQPDLLTSGTTTITVRLCEGVVPKELAIECRELPGDESTFGEQMLRIGLRIVDDNGPATFPRSSRFLLHEVAQIVPPDDDWTNCQQVFAVSDQIGVWHAVALPGKYPSWLEASVSLNKFATTNDAGQLCFQDLYGRRRFCEVHSELLNRAAEKQSPRDRLMWEICSNGSLWQWLDPVASGARLALLSTEIVSVSEDGQYARRWALPPNSHPSVAAAQLSQTETLVLTQDGLGLLMNLSGTDPTFVMVGRLRSRIRGNRALLLREQTTAAGDCSRPSFMFRSPGNSGPCWSRIHLHAHSLLSASEIEFPFEVSNTVRMLRFLQDNPDADRLRKEQTLRDFARRELERFGRWFLPALAENLHNSDLSRSCRHFSLDLLRELQSEEIVGDLLYLAMSGDEEFAGRAVEVLEDYPCEDGRSAYETVLSDHPDPEVRLEAVHGLLNWATGILDKPSTTPDQQALFGSVIQLLCVACGDDDTAKDGVRHAARQALLIVAGFLSLPELEPQRGVAVSAVETVCMAWQNHYVKFDRRWRITAVIMLYLIARGFKQGWLPATTYTMALQTLQTAVKENDPVVRLRALRGLCLLGDRTTLEAIYEGMAKYADTAEKFAAAIMQFGS